MNKPPEGLVPLSALPRDTWVGRSIYHPMMQAGGVPYWRESDAPEIFKDEETENPEEFFYDVGVVTKYMLSSEFYGDDVCGPGHYQVWFKEPSDKPEWGGLHYGADNCWTLP